MSGSTKTTARKVTVSAKPIWVLPEGCSIEIADNGWISLTVPDNTIVKNGAVTIELDSHNLRLQTGGRGASIHTGGGNADLKTAGGFANVNTGGGRGTIFTAGGDLLARTSGGNVHVSPR